MIKSNGLKYSRAKNYLLFGSESYLIIEKLSENPSESVGIRRNVSEFRLPKTKLSKKSDLTKNFAPESISNHWILS